MNFLLFIFGLVVLSILNGILGSQFPDNLHLHFVDLSYSIGNSTIFYPGSKEFVLNHDVERHNGEFWYSSFSFCMGEHGGTHLDAPYHFFKDGWTVEQIPGNHLINVPATLINVEPLVFTMTVPGNFKLQVEHLIAHERMSGQPIPSRGLVLIHTGWSRFWPNKIDYLGIENDTSSQREFNLRFPGISAEAIRWLSEERQIVGIGIDTPSVDQGLDQHYPTHVYAASRQIYNLENVANLHLLLCTKPSPSCRSNNFRALVLPLKIVGGTGAPARIVAMLHKQD